MRKKRRRSKKRGKEAGTRRCSSDSFRFRNLRIIKEGSQPNTLKKRDMYLGRSTRMSLSLSLSPKKKAASKPAHRRRVDSTHHPSCFPVSPLFSSFFLRARPSLSYHSRLQLPSPSLSPNSPKRKATASIQKSRNASSILNPPPPPPPRAT